MKCGVCSVLLASVLLGGCLAPAKQPDPARSDVPTDVHRERLLSGLSLVVETVPQSELAGFALVIDAGAARDPVGKEGLAHWVEHLVFRGRHRAEPSVERKLSAAVASWNGFTSHDVVAFYAFATKAELPQLAQLLADIMSEPLAGIADGVYEHERRVVEAERGFRSDHTPGQVGDWLYQSVFPQHHPYARPVGGTASSIASLTVADASRFVQEYYRPERMTLYVLTPRDVAGAAVVRSALPPQLVGLGQPKPIAPLTTNLPLLPAGHWVRHAAAVPAPELWLSWPLPVATRQQRARAEMLAQVLAVGARPHFGSDPAIAAGKCWLDSAKIQALLSCRLLLNDASHVEDTAARALIGLREVVTSQRTSRDWFWWMKRRFVITHALAEEEPQARSLDFALSAHQYDNPLEQRAELIDTSQLEFSDIAELGFELMAPERTHLMLVTPLPGAATAPNGLTGLATSLEDDDGEVEIDDASHALAALPRRSLHDAQSFKLQNGLSLLIKPEKTPYLTALLGFRGGNGWFKGAAAARAADEAEIFGDIDPDPVGSGIELVRGRTPDHHRETARAVGLGFEKPLLVLEATKNALVEWPSHDFRRLLPTLERYDATAEHRAERDVNALLFGSHPYADYSPAAKLDEVPARLIRDLFAAIHRPERGVLVVVGDVDPEAVRAYAESQFGRWQPPPAEALSLPAVKLQPSETVVVLQHRAASSQADLSLSCLLPFKTADDVALGELVADALRQPVWRRLRAVTGAGYYGTSSSELSSAGVLRIDVETGVDNQHLDVALKVFGDLLRGENTTVSTELFDRTRRDLVKSYALTLATTRAEAGALFDSWLYGLSPADFDALPRLIAETPREKLQAGVSTCLGNAVVSLVGDEPSIRRALREVDFPASRPR